MKCVQARNGLLGTLIILTAYLTFANRVDGAALDRNYDAAIVPGQQLPYFLNLPVQGIRVYGYNAATQTWSPIPFQADQKVGSNYFGDVDEILGADDEVVFLVKDMKDKAPDDQSWPDDEESKQHRRHEIMVTDSNTGNVSYIYVYYSTTLAKSNFGYISYQNDTVTGETYFISHAPNIASGLPESVKILENAGGDELDVLARQRIRLDVHLEYSVVKIDKQIKENYTDTVDLGFLGKINIKTFQGEPPKVIVGPLRILRKNTIAVEITGNVQGVGDINVTQNLPFEFYYYPWYYEMSSGGREIPIPNPGSGVTADLRVATFSNALNGNGKGMIYYNSKMDYGIRVNDTLHNVLVGALGANDWPGKHWYAEVADTGPSGGTLTAATLFSMLDLRGTPIGQARTLWFQEFDDYDGSRYYGDAGLRLRSDTGTISGVLDIIIRNYFFGSNYTLPALQAFFAKYSQPLEIDQSSDYNDHTRPGKITDLRVAMVSETTARLSWTAPADDGYQGRAATLYTMRYSETPYNPNDKWTWWANAIKASNLPVPGTPGTQETFTINGLKPSTLYYFVARCVDETVASPTEAEQNWSDLSDPATGITTPVELASFDARVVENQVYLQWTTESESNNLGFEVEMKRAEERLWQKVAFVKGAGTTNEPRSYSYSEEHDRPGDIEYRLKQIDTNGDFAWSKAIQVSVSAPVEFVLEQNYPNPFNPATTIAFRLPKDVSGMVNLSIFDLLGRKIKILVDERAEAGYYKATWDGRDDFDREVSSGAYLYVLAAGDHKEVKKLIKLK